MAKTRNRFYVVLKGLNPGLYDVWAGRGGAEEQVKSISGAVYKGFATRGEALEYAVRSGYPNLPDRTTGRHPEALQPCTQAPVRREPREGPLSPEHCIAEQDVVIYADGGSINNPGPGGYGVVIREGNLRHELSGGFRHTTNNRMELTGVIEGLRSLEGGPVRPVSVYTDSRYVVDGMSRGWAKKWKRQGWMRDARHRAENIDLWSVLLDLSERYQPRFVWVKGHAGIAENERCDALAKQAALRPDLPPDHAFEKGETGVNQPTLF
ncbi:MAG: ribonuclease H family protein [Desulfomonilia bacterium]